MRISRQPFSRRDKSLRNETVSRFKIECPYTLDPLSKSRNSPSHYASRFNTWRPFELSGFRGCLRVLLESTESKRFSRSQNKRKKNEKKNVNVNEICSLVNYYIIDIINR